MLFPAAAFGQSYTGNYRASFFNFLSDPRIIVIQFEIKADNSVVAIVDPDGAKTRLTGAVEKSGKFVAASEPVGDTVLKLTGKFGKENKVSFVRRTQTGSGMNRSVSENGIEGTFAKFQPPPPLPQAPVLPTDGKSLLNVRRSTPLFTDEWTEMTARIIDEPDNGTVVRRFDITWKGETKERRLQITTRVSRVSERVWRTNGVDVTFASYREIDKTAAARNTFSSTSDTYKSTPALQSGSVEILEDSAGRVVIRLTGFRIKRLLEDDFAEFNGVVYVEAPAPSPK